MKHLKRLSRKQKIALTKLEMPPKNYLRIAQDMDSFTPVDITTMEILDPIRY